MRSGVRLADIKQKQLQRIKSQKATKRKGSERMKGLTVQKAEGV